jgi:flagellar L-ring protein precursor FlgH
VLVLTLGTVLTEGAASAADKRAPRPDEYDALMARHLETARLTKADPNGPRWVDGLFGDPRAHAVNDLLTVRVVESVNATGTADAAVAKSSSGAASLAKLFGLEGKLPSSIDPTNLVTASSDTKFKGGGSTARTGTLTTNLTVRVAEVLHNGDLVLEGAREIEINGDHQVIVLSGIVRAADVGPGNVVVSTLIGQLKVQYFGNGLIHDSLNPGFLVRWLNKIF